MGWRTVVIVGAAYALGCSLACSMLVDLNALQNPATDAGTETGAGASLDAIGDVGVIPDVVVPSCDGACGAPTGFAPVLFALNQATPCPTAMTTLNGAADPSLGAACDCNCAVTTQPSCGPHVLAHSIGDNPGMCSSTSSLTPDVDGGCFSLGSNMGLHAYWSVPPWPPTASGTCTSVPANDPSAATATPSRLCIDPTCQAACVATSGFETCFIASGNVACPGSLTPHDVGNIAVACGTCGGCSVTGGSCGGTVSLYSDLACATLVGSVGVDGGCAATGGPEGALARSNTLRA